MFFGKRKRKAPPINPAQLQHPGPDGDGVSRIFPMEVFNDPKVGGMLRELGFSPDDPSNVLPKHTVGPLDYSCDYAPIVPYHFAEIPEIAVVFDAVDFNVKMKGNHLFFFVDPRTAAGLSHMEESAREAFNNAKVACRPVEGPWRDGHNTFLEKEMRQIGSLITTGQLEGEAIRYAFFDLLKFSTEMCCAYRDEETLPPLPNEPFNATKALIGIAKDT